RPGFAEARPGGDGNHAALLVVADQPRWIAATRDLDSVDVVAERHRDPLAVGEERLDSRDGIGGGAVVDVVLVAADEAEQAGGERLAREQAVDEAAAAATLRSDDDCLACPGPPGGEREDELERAVRI